MGLLYQMPVEENPLDDRIYRTDDGSIVLKTYGLPMLFWGYLAAIVMVVVFMFLAIHHPLDKLIETDGPLNVLIGRLVQIILFLIPFTLISFFFYEKEIIKKGDKIKITHRIFWLPLKSTKISLKEKLSTDQFIGSPNQAKIDNKKDMTGFQNRGYFQIWALDQNSKIHLIDRNSRKSEVKKLLNLLNQF